MVIFLSAKGLTHGEIVAHLAEVYGAEVLKQTITTITDRVMDGMAEWQSRPLDPACAVVFIDALNVKIREGQVANRPACLARGVTVDGERDVLGLWRGARRRVLTEIKNCGVRDVCLLVCDGLKGLPDAVSTVWDKTIVQTCIARLLRNSFRYASKRDWAQVAKDSSRPAPRHPKTRRWTGSPSSRQVGETLPGHHPAVGERVARFRAVPCLRPGNQDRDLHDG